MKILLIERDASLLETIRDICDEEGFTAITASDCVEARRILNEGLIPSLILCDEFLPLNLGKTFQSELQAHPKWKKIPFTLMLAIRPERGAPVSADNLYKPFSMEDLLGLLRKIRPS